MDTPKKHIEYEPGTKCWAEGCTKAADYEVYLYDYYPLPLNEEFYEQDFTCPFLCEEHMLENEHKAVGRREPRGSVRYPYSNHGGAQGYTKYIPLREIYPLLYDGSTKLIVPEVRIAYWSINQELIKHLAAHPEKLRELNPRRFEELVAEIFRDRGFVVEITPKTRDGGKDIYAVRHDSFGATLYLIECKRYASTQKVGVEVVSRLYGVTKAEKATMGIIATTSTFTRDAIDFATPVKYELSLRDYRAITQWLNDYTQTSTGD